MKKLIYKRDISCLFSPLCVITLLLLTIPCSGQKRRSNRVVKRKKYTEDLDIKITDDEDEQEDVDVTTTAAAVASISGGAAAQLKQEVELDGNGQPSMQFFVVSC